MLTKEIQLQRGDGGFGFSVIGGSDTYLPPMVFTIAPGKPADVSNLVEKGDRIISVNGVVVASVSSKQVIQLINEAGSTMKLCLQNDPDLKKRLNAFMQAKQRSVSPENTSTTSSAAPISQAPASPSRAITSPTSGRTLYQPRFTLPNGSSNTVLDITPEQPEEPPDRHLTQDLRINPPDRSYQAPSSDRSYPTQPTNQPTPPHNQQYPSPIRHQPSLDRYEEDHVYNDLDSSEVRNNDGLRQTSLSLLSDSPGQASGPTHGRTYSGKSLSVRDRPQSPNLHTSLFDVNPTIPDDNKKDAHPLENNVPVYAKVQKKKTLPPSAGGSNRPFSGLKTVYNPPPEYEQEPPLPPELPPDIPARETAESCARRLFYQEGCVPEDVSFTLASTVPFDEEVSHYYMQNFNFNNYKLDDAVRVFVERAPLIGENSSRERILYHLSKHLYETNSSLKQELRGPEEVHTLVCALMMLNTDLHSGMVDRKMTYNQFENNLKNTNTHVEKGVLKDLYNGIKAKPIVLGKQEGAEKPKPLPTIEQYENSIHKQGPLVKKNLLLSSGKRPGMFKRRWHRFDAQLRGSKLTLSKSGKKVDIVCHHCLASRAETPHKSRHSVMLLACADGRQFLLQARDDTDMQEWVHSINKVAAMFSALPMAAPVSNSYSFQAPSLPMSRAKCTLEKQLQNHMIQVDKLTQEYDEIIRQQSNQVAPSAEWHSKKRYLETEKEKFEEYAHLLNTLLFPDSEDTLMSPTSFGRATANRMSYKRAVQKNVTPVNV